MSNKKILLFLIDDDALYLRALELEFLSHADFAIKTFSTGEACIPELDQAPDMIVLDYHLDSVNKNAMNGLDTLEKIKDVNSTLPVVMLSSQDSVEIAVNCMRQGVFDYVVKSSTAFLRLQKIIGAILKLKKMENQLKWYMDKN